MGVEISQFLTGGESLVGDLIAGIRTVNGVLNDYKINFPGTGVKDSAGNYMFRWFPGIGVNANYVQVTSSPSTFGPLVQAAGGDTNVNLNVGAQGSGYVDFIGTGAIKIPAGTDVQAPTPFVAGGIRFNQTSGYFDYWSPALVAWVDLTSGSGLSNLTFVTNTDETAFAPNSQPLSLLATGFATVTTTTGIVGSRVLTGTANEITIAHGDGTVGNPTFSIPTTFIAPGTIAAVTSVSAPEYLLSGSGSGIISILPQAAAGTYNFNLPITAGTSGYVLTSAGGGSAPMTWTNLGTAAVTSIAGTANEITASASTGAVTLSIPSTFIAPGSIAATTSSAAASFLLNGSGSGTISILPQAAAGTYNFNLPITAGTSGYLLTSAGGAGSPMTWTNPTSLGTITLTADAGNSTGSSFTLSGGTTGLTTSFSSSTMNLTGTLKSNNGGTSVANSAGSLVALGLSDSGSANAYAVTISPAPAAYAVGQTISFIAAHANTTASTLAINALGTKAITKHGTTALASGDIVVGQVCTVVYDGTQFQLENPVASAGVGTVTSVAASVTPSGAGSVSGSPITTSGTLAFTFKGNLLNIQHLTSGTGATYTPTSGTTQIIIYCVGGGGGGGGSTVATGTFGAGSGGGGGGCAIKYITGINSGSYTGTYTIGAGGAGGSAGANPGNNGNNSTFADGTYTLTGVLGGAGNAGAASAGTGSALLMAEPGGGGTSSGGDYNYNGFDGGVGITCNNPINVALGGHGGGTVLSGGAKTTTATLGTTINGAAAPTNSGAGGAGGAGIGTNTNVAGGNGGAGIIIVYEYS